MKTVEEIIEKIEDESSWVLPADLIEEIIIPAMEEYGKQQYNQAIKDASETCNDQLINYATAKAIKHSILKLLKE